MDDIKFNSINELYSRVLPALKSKKSELVRNNVNYIDEMDIWESLSKKKWQREKNLTLFDIVDDILNINNMKLIEFYRALKNSDEDEIILPKLKEDR